MTNNDKYDYIHLYQMIFFHLRKLSRYPKSQHLGMVCAVLMMVGNVATTIEITTTIEIIISIVVENKFQT